LDEENQKTVLVEFFYKMCVTLKIYAKLNIANWKMKFKPLKVQDLISKLALESHKNSALINCDKFFKITAASPYYPCQYCTLIVFDLSFCFVF